MLVSVKKKGLIVPILQLQGHFTTQTKKKKQLGQMWPTLGAKLYLFSKFNNIDVVK